MIRAKPTLRRHRQIFLIRDKQGNERPFYMKLCLSRSRPWHFFCMLQGGQISF
ncbi:uncharacterized protein FPRN_00286 [Fusarium proliferatum]|nr:uncharacterized protein FPRN_00286 [Fusarium proliferatum]